MGSVVKDVRDGEWNGRWLARWRGPDGRQKKKSFGRRVDADKHLTRTEHDLLTHAYVDPSAGRVTVGAWAEQWLSTRVHLKPKTLYGYRSLLNSRVLPQWADVPLSRVAHEEVAAWVAAMRSDGLSPSRVRQAYHVLTAMLDDAVKAGKLARNPAAKVQLPRLQEVEAQYLTYGQLEALAVACGPYRLLVLVLGYTGLRFGEAAGLRASRVDVSGGRLRVAETAAEVGGRVLFGPPKTHEKRTVPLLPFLREELSERLAGMGPGELLFQAPQGGVLRSGNFRRRYFDRAAADVGLRGFTPHGLRHTAASIAIASGANLKAVQRMLGHKSATLTWDRYGHLYGDELDALAERMEVARREAVVPPVCHTATVTELPRRAASS